MFATATNNDAPSSPFENKPAKTANTLRFAVVTLWYLPAITMAAMTVVDILSVFYFSALFRGWEESLLDYYIKAKKPIVELFQSFAPTLLIELIVTFFLYYIAKQIHRFQSGTSKSLQAAIGKGWAEIFTGDEPPTNGALPSGQASDNRKD